MANLATNLPVLNVPLVDANGNLTVPWLMFLVQLYQRTGADQTPALSLTQVQALALINLIVATANGFAGTVTVLNNEATITLKTTVTGLIKGNGNALSTAVSGLDYAPPTSGSSVLAGNGSGGFSNVSISTGLSFVLGILKINDTTVTAGSYGSASKTLTATVNAQGQLTSLNDTNIAISQSQITDTVSVAKGGTGTSGAYTVATLPAGVLAMRALVTDATAPVFLANVVGGGAVKTPVFYDGAVWKVG
jgi:hypothetical protein